MRDSFSAAQTAPTVLLPRDDSLCGWRGTRAGDSIGLETRQKENKGVVTKRDWARAAATSCIVSTCAAGVPVKIVNCEMGVEKSTEDPPRHRGGVTASSSAGAQLPKHKTLSPDRSRKFPVFYIRLDYGKCHMQMYYQVVIKFFFLFPKNLNFFFFYFTNSQLLHHLPQQTKRFFNYHVQL